jgi:putative membrane protein
MPGVPMTEPQPEMPGGGEPEPPWQRMSPRFIVVGTIRQLRGLVIPAAIVLVTGNLGQGRSELIYIGIALLFAVLAAIGSLVDWWNYRYALTPRELVVRSGIVQKQERAVPYGRIQAINIHEAPLERLAGIVRISVETAAGGTADVDIRAVSREDAPRLREALAAARARASGDGETAEAATPPTDAPAGMSTDTGKLLRSLSTPELLALGATSGRVGPMAAGIGAILQFGTDILPQSWWDRLPVPEADVLGSVSLIVTLLLVIAVVTWLVAIASTALTYGGFELRRSGDQLLIQHGLLDRRRRTIPIARIQAVVVGEQLLRQPFGKADIRFESAGGAHGGAEGDSGVLFPFLSLDEVEPLLREVAPAFVVDPAVPMAIPLPRRAMRRYITAASIGWVLFVAALAALQGLWLHRWIDIVSWREVLLLLLATPLFALLGWARWRDGGWRVDGTMLVLRWRGVSRQTLVTRATRIQRREMTADPFQRRARLATVHVAVASGHTGGAYALQHADRDEAERLLAALGGPRHEIVLRTVPATTP